MRSSTRTSPRSFWWLERRCSSRARSSCSGLTRPRSRRSWPRGFRSRVAIMGSAISSHRLQGRREVGVAFEAVFQSGDLQDLLAVVVEVDELELAEEVLGAALEPKEGFEALAVVEAGLL